MILASKSPRRKELLSSSGVDFFIESAESDELENLCGRAINFLPQENALLKAKAVADKYPDEIVLGADTLVLLNGKALGKPQSAEEAEKMLRQLSGKTHAVVTGIAFVCIRKKICDVRHRISYVTFKKMSDENIKEYMKKVYTLDKAGAYAIQEHGDMIVEKLDGELENVIGLPLSTVFEVVNKYVNKV